MTEVRGLWDAFGEGLFELRLKGSDGIVRVVMLHSFVKKTQKTPLREIDVARKRMKEIKHANS
jgi:phage-related protein